MPNVSRVDRDIWEAFHACPEEVGFESEMAVAELGDEAPRMIERVDWADVKGLDKEAVTKIRVNQHLFRCIVLSGYRGACAVCGMPIDSLLTACHIISWAEDPSNRMNPHNGLCMCLLHHRAFDKGLLVIEPDYHVSIARQATRFADNEAVNTFLIRYQGKAIALPDRWHPDPALLTRKKMRALVG